MKHVNVNLKASTWTLSALLLTGLFFNSCSKDENIFDNTSVVTGLESAVIPDDFNFATVRDVEIKISAPENLDGAVFSLVNYESGVDSSEFARGTFNDGVYEGTFVLPTYIDTVMMVSRYVGLISSVKIPISGNKATLDLTPYYNGSAVVESTVSDGEIMYEKSATVSKFTYMGSYTKNGVPKYLDGRDEIQQNLLDDVNASLPEGKPLTATHPEYLSGAETKIHLIKTADVWVTFVAEGAGWMNALGYYTYQEGHEPASASEIQSLNIIFPNVSMTGSGGGLVVGDRVYLGRFNANTVVSWFLVANGWNGSTVTNGTAIHYAQSGFNAESTSSLREHVVTLYDKSRSQLLLGFEDVPRNQSWCDNDFNDAVFYATVTPFEAVKTEGLQNIDAANDADGDGINDEIDDFPYDQDKAFNNFSPSSGSTGSLAFEDLWPSKGDYDFNDLVVDYNFNLIANAHNKITSIKADFTIKHIGGSFHNGFAFAMPVASSLVQSIEGQKLNAGYVRVASNGTELDNEKAVVFVVENAHPLEHKTISLAINLTTPVSSSSLGSVPFNPFIVVNGDRAHEIHLPDMAPTSLGGELLGTGSDYSDASKSRYYKTERNLPWAISVYKNFTPPAEKVSIDKVYTRFISWANSGGTIDQDWYLN